MIKKLLFVKIASHWACTMIIFGHVQNALKDLKLIKAQKKKMKI